MSTLEQERWNEKYARQRVPTSLEPDSWLVEHISDLSVGRALEVACGLGHNAIWLARHGWSVDAVDISPVGLKLARQFAEHFGQQINWITADVDDWKPQANLYDLIVVFRFLQRDQVPIRIQSALRPGGRLIYETFTANQLHRRDNHVRNPGHTLSSWELPTLFPALETLEYREVELQDRAVAQWVAERIEGS